MATFVELVVIDELGICPLCPTPRYCTDLVRKGAHGDGYGDPFRGEEGELVLPINARRGDRRIRQPVERNVVEDFISRKTSVCLSVEGARDELVAPGVVVN